MTLISVIIPVYNGEKYLAEAIESILSQSYRPLEIIAVDDGSVDGSATIVRGFAPTVTYVYQANGGIGSARNKGISMATGDYFAFLDNDDIWVAEKLARQMAIFDGDPDVELVYGHARQFYTPEQADLVKQRVRMRREVIPATLSSAMLIKRSPFFRVGLFETKWKAGVDQSWHMRAVDQKLNMVMLPDVVYLRRLHSNNQGLQRQFLHERLHIVKSALDRRRQQKDE